MTAIELTFPSGRFHATPWGRHVNEGAVEWPPSPWRLLRAMVATWKGKAPNLAGEPEMRALFTALSAPPEFVLPPATASHTRHYMPWFKKGPGDKTLVFDSFVALEKSAPIVIVWPNLTLHTRQREILAKLLSLLGTLGRAESWCDGRLLDAVDSLPPNCRLVNGAPVAGEVVRVLGVDPSTAFANDQNPHHETSTGKGKSEITTRTTLYDPDWHLCMETLWLHDQRWSLPPGARWLEYDRRKDALAQPTTTIRRPTTKPLMQVARFALDSTVLPLLTDTLPVAEAARFNLLGIHGRLTEKDGVRGKSRAFSGKDELGNRVEGHGHCYYLPTDEDGDGRLDHLTLYAAHGFTQDELRALDRIRQIKTRDREESGIPLGVVLTGVGLASEFRPGPLQPSRNWISATPFFSPRHPKTRGRLKQTDAGSADITAFLLAQMRRELELWAERLSVTFAPASICIELLRDEHGNTRRWHSEAPHWRERAIQFKRFRQKRTDDGGLRPSAFFRLTFPHPVPGPIALGHSSHFGLGLFVPVPETPDPLKSKD